jgi:Glyoxalase-like domain
MTDALDATEEPLREEPLHLPSTAAEVRRLVALGATGWDHQQERGYDDFWVLRDPWGNELCVLQPEFPELLARRHPWRNPALAEG